MKKIILLFTAVIGLSTLQSCEVNDVSGGNQVFEAEVFEVPLSMNTNNYSATGHFSRDILGSDHVLIYRLYGQDNGVDIWRLIPQTVYFTNGDEFDYNYDFTRRDFRIFLEPNFDLRTLNAQDWNRYIMNQVYRIVVIPGRLMQRKMNFNDYEATIKNFGLENVQIKKI